jgi:hypothetical protein
MIHQFYAYTGLSQAMYYGADMKVVSTTPTPAMLR